MKTWFQLSICVIFFLVIENKIEETFGLSLVSIFIFPISIVLIYSTVIRLQGSWEIQVLDVLDTAPSWWFDNFRYQIQNSKIGFSTTESICTTGLLDKISISFCTVSRQNCQLTCQFSSIKMRPSDRLFSSKFSCFDFVYLCFVCWVVWSGLHTPAWSALLSIYLCCLGEEACLFVYRM